MQIAKVAYKSHKNSVNNPYAMYQKEFKRFLPVRRHWKSVKNFENLWEKQSLLLRTPPDSL
jgi:acetyl-CoA acetyltransferase